MPRKELGCVFSEEKSKAQNSKKLTIRFKESQRGYYSNPFTSMLSCIFLHLPIFTMEPCCISLCLLLSTPTHLL